MFLAKADIRNKSITRTHTCQNDLRTVVISASAMPSGHPVQKLTTVPTFYSCTK